MSEFTFRGLMPPVLTPFKDDFSLDLEAIPPYVAHLKKNKIEGILVNGTSGEGMSMNVAERKIVAEAWLKEAHRFGMHVMIQVGGAPLPDVLELAKHAELIGADSILTLPELFNKPASVTELVDYIEVVSLAAPRTHILYYHNPPYSGVHLDMTSMVNEAKSRVKNFRGLKFTSVNLQEGFSVLLACGDQNRIFLGADQILLAASALGFDSSIGTTFNMVAPKAHDILKNMSQKGGKADTKQAQTDQIHLNQSINIITRNGGWVATMKVAMECLTGIRVGPPRLPLKPLPEPHKNAMMLELANQGYMIYR